MTEKEFDQWVSAWIKAQKVVTGSEKFNKLFWAIDKFFELNESDPELCWKGILEILYREKSNEIMQTLADGPLQDLIESHGPGFIDRIEGQVREDPEFKLLLSGVWESSTPEIWARVEAARDEVW